MQYICKYKSILGNIIIISDDNYLLGLYFENQKYFPNIDMNEYSNQNNKIINDIIKWLDIYFSGSEPKFNIPIKFDGTPFQIEVWNELIKIPYAKTTTYGDIALSIAHNRGIKRMSSQAVGGAVGKNKISIIVPCHRVIGKDNSMTGYAGGIDKKIELLKIEGIK